MASSPLFIVSEGEDFEVVAQSRLDRSVRKSLVKFDGTLQKAVFPSGGVLVGNSVDAHLCPGSYAVNTPKAPDANAAGATIVTNVNLSNNLTCTLAIQPDVPRKVNVFITDANSSVTAGFVTIVGVDAAGTAVQEIISIGGGGTKTYKSTYAYATITSIKTSGCVGIDAGTDKIAVGADSALGLPVPAGAVLTVYKEAVAATSAGAAADEAVGTVDQVARSVDPTTAPNGVKALYFWYVWTW